MRVSEAVLDIMANEGYTMYSLSRTIGEKSVNGVRNKLNREYGIRLESLIAICDQLGAEVVIRYYDDEYVLGD